MTTLQEPFNEETTSAISMLNDDCIFKILEWLSLDDLCLFTRTCKRLQTLCENHFRRKYPNETSKDVRIKIERNGSVHVSKYVNYFHNFIKNLSIRVQFNESKKDLQWTSLVHFIKTKCDENLDSISFYGDIELNRLGEEIEMFLRNVKVVTFSGRCAGREDEAIFLKYCPKLTKLILYGRFHGKSVDAILRQQYSQLTHFIHDGPCVLVSCADTMNTFFRTNEKIEFVQWQFNFCAGQKRRNYRALEYIKSLDYAVNLKKLCLEMDGSITHCFYAICNHLNVLYEQGICKSIEIGFDHEKGTQLLMTYGKKMAELKHLTTIHLTLIELSAIMPALRSLDNLKVVGLSCLIKEDFWIEWTNLDELIAGVDSAEYMCLPQVEEVQFDQMYCNKELFVYVMLCARHWTNLKRILVPWCREPVLDWTILERSTLAKAYNLIPEVLLNEPPSREASSSIVNFLVPELNQAREKLKDACELTIFTNHKGNATNVNHKLVKLKFVQFECSPMFHSDSFQQYFVQSSE